ncbi:MAG TPA: hypothetical protein VLF39_01400 [Candidatus Saccharimonadales bacterium]|nr:hypothetical protein [Candidatus Saccharimonadales bacterium]
MTKSEGNGTMLYDQDADTRVIAKDPTLLDIAKDQFSPEKHRVRNHRIGALVLAAALVATVPIQQNTGFFGHMPKPTPEFTRQAREAIRVNANDNYQQSNFVARYNMTYINPPDGWPKYDGKGVIGWLGELDRHDEHEIAAKTNSCLRDTPYDLNGYTPEGQTKEKPGATIVPLFTGVAITPGDKHDGQVLALDGVNGNLGDLHPWRSIDKEIVNGLIDEHIECLTTP